MIARDPHCTRLVAMYFPYISSPYIIFNNCYFCVISFDLGQGVRSLKLCHGYSSKSRGCLLSPSWFLKGPGVNFDLKYNVGICYLIGY